VKLRIDPTLNGQTVGATVNFNIYTSNYTVNTSAAPLPSGYANGTNHIQNTGHAHVYATYLDDGLTFHETYAFLGAGFPGTIQPGQTTLPASITLPKDGRWMIVTMGQYYDHTARIGGNPEGWDALDAVVVNVHGSANQTLTAVGEDPNQYASYKTVAPAYIDSLPARVAFAPGLTGSTVTGLNQIFPIHTQNLFVNYSAAEPSANYDNGDRLSNEGHVNIYGTYLDNGNLFHTTNLFLGTSDISTPSQDPTLMANISFPAYGHWLLEAQAVYNDDTPQLQPHPMVWGVWDFAYVNVVPEPSTLVLLASLAPGIMFVWRRTRKQRPGAVR
jgi:hypothetical protein